MVPSHTVPNLILEPSSTSLMTGLRGAVERYSVQVTRRPQTTNAVLAGDSSAPDLRGSLNPSPWLIRPVLGVLARRSPYEVQNLGLLCSFNHATVSTHYAAQYLFLYIMSCYVPQEALFHAQLSFTKWRYYVGEMTG